MKFYELKRKMQIEIVSKIAHMMCDLNDRDDEENSQPEFEEWLKLFWAEYPDVEQFNGMFDTDHPAEYWDDYFSVDMHGLRYRYIELSGGGDNSQTSKRIAMKKIYMTQYMRFDPAINRFELKTNEQ